MSTPTNIRDARKAKRGTYRYADLVLDAWDRMFGQQDAAAERDKRREQKWRRAEIERKAKSRL